MQEVILVKYYICNIFDYNHMNAISNSDFPVHFIHDVLF